MVKITRVHDDYFFFLPYAPQLFSLKDAREIILHFLNCEEKHAEVSDAVFAGIKDWTRTTCLCVLFRDLKISRAQDESGDDKHIEFS
jgi:hypothetical protein